MSVKAEDRPRDFCIARDYAASNRIAQRLNEFRFYECLTDGRVRRTIVFCEIEVLLEDPRQTCNALFALGRGLLVHILQDAE